MEKLGYFIPCSFCGQPTELIYYYKHKKCYGFCERCNILFSYPLSSLLEESGNCPNCEKETQLRGHLISLKEGVAMKCSFCGQKFIFMYPK